MNHEPPLPEVERQGRAPRREILALMQRKQATEAERLLAAVLQAISAGDLAADGPAATAVAHRLEGALLALCASRSPAGPGPGDHVRSDDDEPPPL